MEDYESGRHSTLRFIRNILLHYYYNICMVHPHTGQVSSMVLIAENETVLTTIYYSVLCLVHTTSRQKVTGFLAE